MIIAAPAKVNLYLAVLDKRPDGFHNIESLFVALDFEDSLHFDSILGNKNGFLLDMEWQNGCKTNIPIEENIIFKALSLFREKTGFSEGLKIRVEKRIPAGGGLGGGSSNAAAALLAFNSLAGHPLEQTELLELGAALGSDVPFFLRQIPAAWVTGRGEEIEPLAPPNWHFVLVNPGFHSDTGTAFSLLDQHRRSLSACEGSGIGDRGQENINSSSASPRLRAMEFVNDFLPILPEKSTYNRIIQQLTQLGAEFAGLSGSGSTCFGAFNGKKQAENAALSLKNEWDFAQSCSVKKSFP